MNAPTWRTLPRDARALGFWLMIVEAVGYSTSLVLVWWKTKLAPAGVARQYRGDGAGASEEAMHFAKSFAEMLALTHTHLLALAAVFSLSGLALVLTERVPVGWKRWLIVEPFVALLVSFAALWATRYLHPAFGTLVVLSGALMAVTFYLQTGLVLRELWGLRRGA